MPEYSPLQSPPFATPPAVLSDPGSQTAAELLAEAAHHFDAPTSAAFARLATSPLAHIAVRLGLAAGPVSPGLSAWDYAVVGHADVVAVRAALDALTAHPEPACRALTLVVGDVTSPRCLAALLGRETDFQVLRHAATLPDITLAFVLSERFPSLRTNAALLGALQRNLGTALAASDGAAPAQRGIVLGTVLTAKITDDTQAAVITAARQGVAGLEARVRTLIEARSADAPEVAALLVCWRAFADSLRTASHYWGLTAAGEAARAAWIKFVRQHVAVR